MVYQTLSETHVTAFSNAVSHVRRVVTSETMPEELVDQGFDLLDSGEKLLDIVLEHDQQVHLMVTPSVLAWFDAADAFLKRLILRERQ